jgi:hypothetical protein
MAQRLAGSMLGVRPSPRAGRGFHGPGSTPEAGAMVELMIVLAVVAIFEVAAWRWGVDSTDGINSSEWSRRRDWPGFRRTSR